MVKFISTQFPNIKVNGVRFENGYYSTDKEDEITILKELGFEYIDEEPTIADSKKVKSKK